MKMPGVDGRVVIVTGAGGGLGREYALDLAANGARVVVNDLGGARDGSGAGSAMADEVVAEIREAGGEAVANYDSVATAEGAAGIVATALDAFGSVHGVVSNAGILRDASFAKLDDAGWDAVQQVHLYGGYYVTHAVWPLFREQGFGRIVVATSTSGLYGNFGQANYGAAKSGLIGLINTLAIEGAKNDIKANAIAPLAATRMTEDIAPAEFLEKLPPAFVAPVVTHLMSEELEETGSVFVVGGGQVQRVQQFQNKGVTFATPPTASEVADRWSEITDMAGATPGRNPLG
ncbi:MAG: SDR family oxidoreductase [Nocardioides sp.]|uniref:SDR family oxidoreductase n=1 Tax=Nocardioides sp. TaxID=35761 RepID=UPI0039E2C115